MEILLQHFPASPNLVCLIIKCWKWLPFQSGLSYYKILKMVTFSSTVKCNPCRRHGYIWVVQGSVEQLYRWHKSDHHLGSPQTAPLHNLQSNTKIKTIIIYKKLIIYCNGIWMLTASIITIFYNKYY